MNTNVRLLSTVLLLLPGLAQGQEQAQPQGHELPANLLDKQERLGQFTRPPPGAGLNDLSREDFIKEVKRRLEQLQIPVPGAVGTVEGQPGREQWKACKTTGMEVIDTCSSDSDLCSILDGRYRDACFDNVGSVGDLVIGPRDKTVRLDLQSIHSVLAAIFIDDKPLCTGVMLDARHLLTAGHCTPQLEECWGLDGCSTYVARPAVDDTRMHMVSRVSPDYSENEPLSDFAIWTLDRDVVATSRVKPWARADKPVTERQPAYLSGVADFPCSAEDGEPCKGASILWQPSWFTQCAVTCGNTAGLLYHDCQTKEGMSGAPMIVGTENGQLQLAGIHTRYHSLYQSPSCNTHTQVSVSMGWICTWIENHYAVLKGACDG